MGLQAREARVQEILFGHEADPSLHRSAEGLLEFIS